MLKDKTKELFYQINREQSEVIKGGGVRIDLNRDYFGNDYRKLASNLKDCIKACEDDRRCEAFTFNGDTNTCWLKDPAPPLREVGPLPSADWIAGKKIK